MSSTTVASPQPEDPHAEPGPDWSVARKQWNLAWELHWIGFGILFSFLALHSIVALVHTKRRKTFARPPIFIAINVMLALLGLTRAVYLFLDPYASSEHGFEVPLWISKTLFGLAYPCLTSSFCFLHLAFLEVTKLRLGSPKLRNPRFFLVIIVIHFIVVLTAEITTALESSTRALLIVCQSFFILWGLFLSASFIYSGTKVIRQRANTRRQLAESGQRSEANARPGGVKNNIAKVAKITLAVSGLGLACCALQIYSLFGVYGLYTTSVNVEPWPWWIFQTSFRLTEFGMAVTLSYSVMQPAGKGPPRHGQVVTLSEVRPTTQ